jgi:uncharacterized DUF497 family protein
MVLRTQPEIHFAWDEKKRQSNIAKHGIDFLLASQMFDGRVRLDFESPRGNEQRTLSIAELDGKLIAVAWTWRDDDVVRIISARRARREEERTYRELCG